MLQALADGETNPATLASRGLRATPDQLCFHLRAPAVSGLLHQGSGHPGSARQTTDDPGAKATVRDLLDQFGFDTVDAGPLKEEWRIQHDTPGYGPRRTAEELRGDLTAAKRYADQ